MIVAVYNDMIVAVYNDMSLYNVMTLHSYTISLSVLIAGAWLAN